MKKQLFMTIVMMVAATVMLNAQEKNQPVFADTLYISGTEDYRLMIVSENISKYEPADTLNRVFNEVFSKMLVIEFPEMRNRYFKIFYNTDEQGNAALRFKDVSDEDKRWVVLENGETLPPAPVELIIPQGTSTRMHCFLNSIFDVEMLADQDVQALVADVLAKQEKSVPNLKRVAITTMWNVEDGQPKDNATQFYRNTEIGDQIELSGTIGASLIRNTLVPSIDLMVGVSIANKTRIRHKANIDLSMNYIFNEKPEGGFNTDINTFIGASYFINTSRYRENPNWYGMGVAYLAWQNGDFFEKDTWRVSMGAKFGDRYSILPELYIGDNFKKVMPGLKLKIWF